MEKWLFLGLYLLLAGLVVFLSIKLSDYVDALDKKTKLSGALLGGILLAAVTSLPELFTSLTGTIGVGKNTLVLGNIVGSDFFDIVVFSLVYFIFFKKLTEGKVGKQHYYTILFTAIMTGLITAAAFIFSKNGWLLFGFFNPMSILIIIVYVIFIWKTPKTEEKEEKEEEDTSKLTVKQIWILFAICSIVLIGASIAVTFVTDEVVTQWGIGETFGGSLFLGVATSLPEVTATLSLSKKKNFDAAYGDIFGSCVFNIIILAIADIFSFKAGPLFNIDQTSFLLIIGLTFVLAVALVSIVIIRSPKFKNSIKNRVALYVCATLLLGTYVTYLLLSNINLNIPFAPFQI